MLSLFWPSFPASLLSLSEVGHCCIRWRPWCLFCVETGRGGLPWLRHHTSTAGGTGLIPGQGTKIPHAPQYDQNRTKTVRKESGHLWFLLWGWLGQGPKSLLLQLLLGQPCSEGSGWGGLIWGWPLRRLLGVPGVQTSSLVPSASWASIPSCSHPAKPVQSVWALGPLQAPGEDPVSGTFRGFLRDCSVADPSRHVCGC